MSELINLAPKEQTLQGYELATPGDMFSALQYVAAGGYAGTINLTLDGAGQQTWQLWVNNATNSTSQAAAIGDWIVLENNSIARVVPAAQFANRYTTT